MNAIPTERTLFDAGCDEEFKHAYHATLWWLVVGAGAWNLAAFLKRGEPQLAVNAALYAALIALSRARVRGMASRPIKPNLVTRR